MTGKAYNFADSTLVHNSVTETRIEIICFVQQFFLQKIVHINLQAGNFCFGPRFN